MKLSRLLDTSRYINYLEVHNAMGKLKYILRNNVTGSIKNLSLDTTQKTLWKQLFH